VTKKKRIWLKYADEGSQIPRATSGSYPSSTPNTNMRGQRIDSNREWPKKLQMKKKPKESNPDSCLTNLSGICTCNTAVHRAPCPLSSLVQFWCEQERKWMGNVKPHKNRWRLGPCRHGESNPESCFTNFCMCCNAIQWCTMHYIHFPSLLLKIYKWGENGFKLQATKKNDRKLTYADAGSRAPAAASLTKRSYNREQSYTVHQIHFLP
jgi:hypothetical protein